MYSDEIKRMLDERQRIITGEEYNMAFNPKISTQINYIKYDQCSNIFTVITNDNHYFQFMVYPPNTVKEKVKKL